jgi:uncharacterized membrane protein YcaP (DUF421 family)
MFLASSARSVRDAVNFTTIPEISVGLSISHNIILACTVCYVIAFILLVYTIKYLYLNAAC